MLPPKNEMHHLDIYPPTMWGLGARSEAVENSYSKRVVSRYEPPQILFVEIAGFETSSRPYLLLKYSAPCHPDVIVLVL